MDSPHASPACGDELPILLSHHPKLMPDPAHRLTLTRAQRRGAPVMARKIIAEIAEARRPAELRDALDRLIGYAGAMSKACYRRGWPLAGNYWSGAAIIARRMQDDGRPRKSVNRWITSAERMMYQAANMTGRIRGPGAFAPTLIGC